MCKVVVRPSRLCVAVVAVKPQSCSVIRLWQHERPSNAPKVTILLGNYKTNFRVKRSLPAVQVKKPAESASTATPPTSNEELTEEHLAELAQSGWTKNGATSVHAAQQQPKPQGVVQNPSGGSLPTLTGTKVAASPEILVRLSKITIPGLNRGPCIWSATKKQGRGIPQRCQGDRLSGLAMRRRVKAPVILPGQGLPSRD